MRFLPNKSSGQQWRSGISNHQWPAVHKFGRQYVPEYHVGSWVMQWLVRSLDTPKPMHQRNWFHALPFLVQYLARHNRAHDACIAPAARPPNFGQGYSWRRFLLPPKGVNNQPKHIKGEDNVWIWIMTGRTSFERSFQWSVWNGREWDKMLKLVFEMPNLASSCQYDLLVAWYWSYL